MSVKLIAEGEQPTRKKYYCGVLKEIVHSVVVKLCEIIDFDLCCQQLLKLKYAIHKNARSYKSLKALVATTIDLTFGMLK